MKRIFLLALISVMMPLTMLAQSRLISGALIDRDTKEPMIQTTVQLLRADSSFVAGAISNDKGLFSLSAPSNGRYLLKVSSVGYTTSVKRIEIVQDKNLAMGVIAMGADAVMLKGATVTAQAQKVTLKEDTFIYNSAAFRTPEGSTIEELVKRLPGADIDDNGKITIYGKEVKKIMVDGKEFMTGDTKTALKNLPTSIVDKIKAYDEKSDLARVTGIDDGDEQTVLDFGLKRGMNKGMFSNVDLSIGTKDLFAERAMAAMFNDKSRFMIMGSANNVNDRGFGGGGRRFGGNQQGLNTSKMIGMNYNFEQKNKLQIDASVRWNHTNGDLSTTSSVQNFVSKVGSFSNSKNQNYSRGNSWDARGRLEWTPDTMTNIMFRPSFTYSTSDSRSFSTSASYKDDPYLYVLDPLSPESIAQMASDSLMVNERENQGLSYSESKSIKGMLQYNRKFGNRGRNFTVQVNANYGNNDNKSLSLSDVVLYQLKNAMGLDSTYQTNRWNLTPSKNWGYRIRTTYSEPLWRATFLQLSYEYNFSTRRSDRSTFDFSHVGRGLFDNVPLAYRGWDGYLSLLSNPLESYLDKDLSRYAEYQNYTQDIEAMFRMIRSQYNFSAGILIEPQKSHYKQNYQGVSVDTVRNVTNITPTLDFRYRFSKVSNLRINYRGSTTQPDISDLLDITDDSNPLNISKGNPGLKPSFTDNLRFFYNTYFEKHQRAIMTFLNYNTTRNSISNKVTYNEVTGGRVTQPENINGNWDAQGGFMFNTAIDSAGVYNINTFTSLNYNNYVGYLSLQQNSDSEKNTTKSLGVNERLATSYRNSWLEVELDGSLNYMHSRNQLQSQSNLDTWQFSYGATVNVNAPWGTSLTTDLHENSRRGFNDNAMNTNELVWNAQLSQSFLKGRPLTISLQLYDILHNQSNFSRTINAVQRNDQSWNSINSYAMLHVIYRLNIFGSKEMRTQMEQQRRDREHGDGPGRFGGRRGQGGPDGPGGFGGRGGGGFGRPHNFD